MSHNLFINFHNRSNLQVGQSTTLDSLLQTSKNWTFVDTLNVNYGTEIQKEIDNPTYSPFSNNGTKKSFPSKNRTIVVGAGASGLLCAYELLKFGMGSVKLFEAYEDPRTTTNSVRAGRLYQVNLDAGDDKTAVQLGAMRFPDLSQAFWHYYKLFVHPTDNPSLTPFPNPSKVPTILFAKNSNLAKELAYYLPIASNTPFPLPPDIQAIADKHVNAFLNYTAAGQSYSLSSIMSLLQVASMTAQNKTIVTTFFEAMKKDVGQKSYKEFLVFRGLTAAELQIISDIGFGTGGFGPLFDVSVIDLTRLVLWNYSSEFEVPDQAKLPVEMLKKIQAMPGASIYHNRPVDAVYFDLVNKEYLVISGTEVHRADYLVLAMTHNAALELLDRSESARTMGTYSVLREHHVTPMADGRAKNFVQSELLSDMRLQTNIPSSKVFHSVKGPGLQTNYPVLLAPGAPNITFPVRCVTGDTMSIGNRYILPQRGEEFTSAKKCIGLHYGWGETAKHVSLAFSDFFDKGRISLDATSSLVPKINQIINTELSYTYNAYQWTKDTAIQGNDSAYFGAFGVSAPGYGALQGIYWNDVPYVKCGFKLDRPGVGAFMSWNAADRTAYAIDDNGAASGLYVWENRQLKTQHAAVARLFFCGDSFSFYGGWVEGAFQSALMASAGVINRFAVDNDRKSDVNSTLINSLFSSRPA